MLCGIGVRFNFVCDEMLGGMSDEPALRTGRCLQAFNRRKPLLASIMPAAAQRQHHDGTLIEPAPAFGQSLDDPHYVGRLHMVGVARMRGTSARKN